MWRYILGVERDGKVDTAVEVVDWHVGNGDERSRVLHALSIFGWAEDCNAVVTGMSESF